MQTMNELRTENERLRAALEDVRTVISGLIDQQAMDDRWYVDIVARIDSALRRDGQ